MRHAAAPLECSSPGWAAAYIRALPRAGSPRIGTRRDALHGVSRRPTTASWRSLRPPWHAVSTAQVCAYLDKIGLADVAPAFRDNEVVGECQASNFRIPPSRSATLLLPQTQMPQTLVPPPPPGGWTGRHPAPHRTLKRTAAAASRAIVTATSPTRGAARRNRSPVATDQCSSCQYPPLHT
eukprot:362997-Chlamydomonas_euryale.AAC.1